jgi:signal transduction histidine kinase
LDTKSKSSQNKYIVNTIILTIIALIALGMFSTYPKINEQSNKYKHNVFENPNFLEKISNSNYGIYFDILKNKENKDIEPAEAILNLDKKYTDYSKADLEFHKDRFNEEIYSYYRELNYDLRNLEYYAVKKDSQMIDQRNQGNIEFLLNNNIDSNTIEELNRKYSFYIVVDYDDYGKSTIKQLYGAGLPAVTQELNHNNISRINRYELKPIKNMTFVYAVPRELTYRDLITTYKERNEGQSFKDASIPFINIAIAAVLFAALVIPYKISKELVGFKVIAKTPIELVSCIIIFTLIFIFDEFYSIIHSTITGELANFSEVGISLQAAYVLTIIINICIWALCFGILYIGAVNLKHIFKTGIIRYIKESSLIYKILRSIWRCNRRIFSYFNNIDLKEKNTKKIVSLLSINLVILILMSSMWFLGIIVAIIYTVVLFKIIRKKYNDLNNKYIRLLDAAKKIAEGNLDVTIQEDLGLFNALKIEIESIQKGFKKAVDEEVKSQRMKTELISNVSHDLKTPLTSIITYVDLLKDENLSVEKRREYLDTLDRKSQRLQELIEDLFEVSKATSGNINLNIVDVDIVELMKQTLLELSDKISKASLVVKTSYPKEKVILPLDSQRMFRVFENLIINITKYAMTGSRVYIDITYNNDKVEITLKNMAANELEFSVNDIVERFVRGDKARNTEGSGLGLAIAKSFVELQGGQLNIFIDGDLFKVVITFPKNKIML